MDVIGHIGMALLFVTPLWFVFETRTDIALTALAIVGGLIPDADLYLRHYFPIVHHGVIHSLTFAVLFGLVGGAVVTGIALVTRAVWDTPDAPTDRIYTLSAGVLALGVLAHLFADLLTTPDVAPPLKPFLPFSQVPVIVDAFYVYSTVVNWGTFVLGVVVVAAAAAFRIWGMDEDRVTGSQPGR